MKLKKTKLDGYISIWPTRRIVKVSITKLSNTDYPIRVTSLERGVSIGGFETSKKSFDYFDIADISLITVYPTYAKAVKTELESIHETYAKERRALRHQQLRYKWTLRSVDDYKHFDELQVPFFIPT